MKDLKIKITIDSNVKEVSIARGEFQKLGGVLAQGAKDIMHIGTKFKETTEILAHASLAAAGVKSALAAATAPMREMVRISADFERQKSILKVLEGDAQGAEKSFEWIKEFAAKTPYELGQVTEAFIKARSYGIDPTNGTLQTLGDTAAAMGKDIIQAVEAMADAMTGENERLKEFGIKAKIEGDNVAYSWTSTSGEAKSVIEPSE